MLCQWCDAQCERKVRALELCLGRGDLREGGEIEGGEKEGAGGEAAVSASMLMAIEASHCNAK